MPLLHRIARKSHPVIAFILDGEPCEGRAGDTVLTAILNRSEVLRVSEFSASPRAGFCQMGACQDCWVRLEGGARLRACTTALAAGMRIVTAKGRVA
ncbi:(2Fe-2S)-binding protein [Bosea sp. 2YAB26]|uniref:(2Fe-2S)-binding protein n=1 Tax=Bosea sp. 2YAB26 TaxID=3237478 RepID=UPI003F8E22C4